MKMLIGNPVISDYALKRFDNEIKIMSQLNHPNIIRLYDTGKYCGSKYFVMEFLEGVNLESFILTNGRLSEKFICLIALDLGNAISAIHNNGIIHRDIKPKNAIYFPGIKHVKLCDFGISQDSTPLHLTHPRTTIGTPIYMAPETFRGEPATAKSDIYSYGATMYQLITNSPPFVAENYGKLYDEHFYSKPKPIKSFRPEFSKKWSDIIINKCMATDPDDRPDSIEEILEDIKGINRRSLF